MKIPKERFKQLKSLFKKGPKATAELEASKNPMKYLKNSKNMKLPPHGLAM